MPNVPGLIPIRDLTALCTKVPQPVEELLSATNVIVHITTQLNRQMAMWQAIQLWEYGLTKFYLENLGFRQAFDLWCTNEDWANLDWRQFVGKCGYPSSILMAAQTACDPSTIPMVLKKWPV